MSFCPTKSSTTSTTAALASAIPRRCASSPLPSAIAGITISKGISARSWKSSPPTMSRPWGVSSCMRSARMRRTIAVDGMAIAPPTTRAACQGAPTSDAAASTATSVSRTWEKPSPNTARRSWNSLGRLNSSPIENIRNTTPNSARCRPSSVSGIHASAWGPTATPTKRYPSSGGKCSQRNSTTTSTALASRISTSSSVSPIRKSLFFWDHVGKSADSVWYTPTYDKGSSRRGPARFLSMNDRSKKANSTSALELARKVLSIEADAVSSLISRLDERFLDALGLILACRGRVVVSGVGKSGHIARKIASTLASTGTPAFFVHAPDAGHGDLGMITRDDVVLALSNSGQSDELLTIIPRIKRQGAKLIALTGNPDSALAREADVHLDAGVAQEACPLNLAPTASTTAALALGDALAVALLDARGFHEQDSARAHPGGALGRKLLIHVSDVMRTGNDVPAGSDTDSFSDLLAEISRKSMGMTAILGPGQKLVGIFTDGDLRRTLERKPDVRTLKIADVMKRSPHTIAPNKLAAEALELMERHKINQLLVATETAELVGALNMHDLFRAKVI